MPQNPEQSRIVWLSTVIYKELKTAILNVTESCYVNPSDLELSTSCLSASPAVEL